jgi:superfamily II DNA or RNA helicase
VVVDEAHWFRNARTRRYRSIARRYRSARWLLLSATPVHNRERDLRALLQLFRGAAGSGRSPNEIAALLLHRGRREAADGGVAAPEVLPVRWIRPRVDPRLLEALRAITLPVPLRDGSLAMGLLRLTLYRRLASSHAALRQSLLRLLTRALALQDALAAGRYPSARELRAWLLADDAVQLALPGLLASAGEPNEPLRLDAHVASVRAALDALSAAPNTDARRIAKIHDVLRAHPGARVVAFSQCAATVRAFAAGLRDVPGVAVLTAAGARIASGAIGRDELLRQFESGQGPVRETMRVRLLLTTDVLSEGVNMQNASVLLHLDLPWTPARLEQRVGRLSRAGSPHREITLYGFAPPNAVVELERSVARLRTKYAAAARVIPPAPALREETWLGRSRPSALSGHAGDLRALLARWAAGSAVAASTGGTVACVRRAHGDGPEALALLRGGAGVRLVAVAGERVSEAPSPVLRVARCLDDAHPAAIDRAVVRRVLSLVERYVAQRRGESAALAPRQFDGRAMERRLAEAVYALPRAQRAWGLEVAVRIRGLLADARSLGDYVVAAECCEQLRRLDAEPADWLRTAQSCLAGAFLAPGPSDAPPREEVDALLIGV